jgi:hypothetical protein
MSSIKLESNASGTGTLTVASPNTNTDRTLTLPDGTGTVAVNGVNGVLVSDTAKASTSGTSIDFTGIPSWVKRITVMFSGVSLSGTDDILVQLGDSGGLETSGYLGAGCYAISAGSTVGANYTTGFGIKIGNAAGVIYGVMTISKISDLTWVSSSSGGFSNAAAAFSGGGSKTLSDTLDRISVTRTGTNTFDAGTINILYE